MALTEKMKHERTLALLKSADFIRFHQSLMWRPTANAPASTLAHTGGYRPLEYDTFRQMAYLKYPGILESNIRDIHYELTALAPDRTPYGHLFATATYTGNPRVWDMRAVQWDDSVESLLGAVYQTRIVPTDSDTARAKVWTFLTELGAGDSSLANDYLQACAPLLLERKPAGVIWFVGDGANGKSSLINLLYRLFGPYLTSLTAAAIEDGRAVPSLRGALGNIVRESSESRIEDSERYKAIGTHEPLTVRLMRSNETTTVTSGFHTIFNANNIPTFADKTQGARRRTLVVPFPAHFKDDSNFEDRTFTPAFQGAFLQLLTEAAVEVAQHGYQWSERTMEAKRAYDDEVNSAEAYVDYLLSSSIRGFHNYQLLKMNYEVWCSNNGMEPLRIISLKRALTNSVHPQRVAIRENNRTIPRYVFDGVDQRDLQWLDIGYGVLLTTEEQLRQEVAKPEQLGAGW